MSTSREVKFKSLFQLFWLIRYKMGLIATKSNLENSMKVTASSFCRRRLPVVMVRLHMAQTVKNAVEYIEQGHVRVGPELVLDPAFLVTRFVNCFPYFSNICFDFIILKCYFFSKVLSSISMLLDT